MAEARVILNEVYKGYQLCVLQHGTDDNSATHPCGPNLLNNLDVQLPGKVIDCVEGAEHCVITKGWVYEWDNSVLFANRMDSFNDDIEGYQYNLYLPLSVSDGKIKCYSGENTWFCPKLCGSNGCEVK